MHFLTKLIQLTQTYEKCCPKTHDDGDFSITQKRSTGGDQIGQDRSHQNFLGHTVSSHYSRVAVHDHE